MTRLGFLGAMNRDVVADTPGAGMLRVLGVDAKPLLETPVSDETAQRGAERLAAIGATYLGGSAFNAARVTALLNADRALDLAFFGIAGTLGITAPHLDALRDWGVDTSGVHRSTQPPATCLAMVESAGRTLLTASGANAGIATWLRENMANLAKDLARCDAVHVTSYLDPAAPGLIAGLLTQARQINPALLVSLDPGMAWLRPRGPELEHLLKQADILHLNDEELAELGGAANAAAIGTKLRSDWLIVARTHVGVTLHQADTPSRQTLQEQPLPDPIRVIDATGAGDTFCGAFLWSYLGQRHAPVHAAALGFTLAREKIGTKGPLAMTGEVRSALEQHQTHAAGW